MTGVQVPVALLGLYQTFAKVFTNFAVPSRKGESRAKVAVPGPSREVDLTLTKERMRGAPRAHTARSAGRVRGQASTLTVVHAVTAGVAAPARATMASMMVVVNKMAIGHRSVVMGQSGQWSLLGTVSAVNQKTKQPCNNATRAATN